MKISYSFGMVDLLHYGHIKALQTASRDSDLSYFGLVSDEACDAWYGGHVSDEGERRAVLEGIKFIDIVMYQKTLDPVENLKEIHAQYPDAEITLFRSSEWKVEPSIGYLRSIGGKVISVDYYEKMSLSNIIAALNKKNKRGSRVLGNLVSTKADTLRSLQGILKRSRIEKMAIFTVDSYLNGFDYVYQFISDNFFGDKVVVRSSSKREDAFEFSNAGHFTSVLGVDSFDKKQVRDAFGQVVQSYYDGTVAPSGDEQILVQKQTDGVACSGVVFTRDIQKGRPYYVINYDEGGSTDSVTSGAGGRTAWLRHDVPDGMVPAKWKKLIGSVRELESILADMLLDIEFAVTVQGDVVIFQVRPLAAGYKVEKDFDSAGLIRLYGLALSSYDEQKKRGLRLFSDMAFWNPAEIIGEKPHCLDYSLYRDIITHRAWSGGLAQMGYQLVPDDLMYRFGNKPYISLEHSFEGLTPSSLDGAVRDKLAGYYCRKFCEDISCHDKIEFEVVFSCYDFSLLDRLSILKGHGFSDSEVDQIYSSLKELTINVISSYKDMLENDLKDLMALESIRAEIEKRNDADIGSVARSIRDMLAAVKAYGTPQFARQARCAFMAKSLCLSLVDKGYISRGEYDAFMASVSTVATEFEAHFAQYQDGSMARDEFMGIYGHLRAGTYDIQSPRYDQMRIFSEAGRHGISSRSGADKQQKGYRLPEAAISRAVADAGATGVSAGQLMSFMKLSVEEREHFKFLFTRSLSFAIELIRKAGGMAGIPAADMSFLDIQEIEAAAVYEAATGIKETWEILISKRKEDYSAKAGMVLPSVITGTGDFYYTEYMDARPNFVTEKVVSGIAVVLEGEGSDIAGKIVMLEKADPGFDWIFAEGILGLITKYGGAASHMAIRCAEFGIPAAIGCGERIYQYAVRKDGQNITVDCANGEVR